MIPCIYHLAASANESSVREIRMSHVSYACGHNNSYEYGHNNSMYLPFGCECEWVRCQNDTNESCLREIPMRHDSFVSTNESGLKEKQVRHDSFGVREIRLSHVSHEYGQLLLQLLLGVQKNIQTWTRNNLWRVKEIQRNLSRISYITHILYHTCITLISHIYHTCITHEDGEPFLAAENYKGIYHSYQISHIYNTSHTSYITLTPHMKTSTTFEVSERYTGSYHRLQIYNLQHIIFTTHMKTKQPLICQRDVKEYITHIKYIAHT